MNNCTVFDDLDLAIDRLLAVPSDTAQGKSDSTVNDLMEVADDLRYLPRADFRSRLNTELQWVASGRPVTSSAASDNRHLAVMPSLFGKGSGIYPVRRSNFAASMALHVAMALFMGFGLVAVRHAEVSEARIHDAVRLISPYLPVTGNEGHGGGGGGEHSTTNASKGTAPEFAAEQLAVPAVVLPNKKPLLAIEPTIVGQPDIRLPQSHQPGDPLADLVGVPSSGVGFSGIGGGANEGVGTGKGPGFGVGSGGNIGDGIFHPGNGISAPRLIYNPDPEYSDEARKAHYQGTVTVFAVIGTDGHPRNLRVERSLGMGLDEKALEAVRNWRFEPATKDGRPVSVMIDVLVDFRLY